MEGNEEEKSKKTKKTFASKLGTIIIKSLMFGLVMGVMPGLMVSLSQRFVWALTVPFTDFMIIGAVAYFIFDGGIDLLAEAIRRP